MNFRNISLSLTCFALLFTLNACQPISQLEETQATEIQFEAQEIGCPHKFCTDFALSPDNSQLVLVTDLLVSEDAPILIGETNLSNLHPLIPELSNNDVNVHGLDWSPDGQQIAFYLKPNLSSSLNRGIYVVNPDGSDFRPIALLPNLKTGYVLSWSPDSHQILFTQDDPANGVWLSVVDVETQIITPLKFFDEVLDGDWSSKGEVAIIRSETSNDQAETKAVDVYVFSPSNSQERTFSLQELNPSIWLEGDLAWSPDGEYLALTASDHSTFDTLLYLVRADGKEPKLISKNNGLFSALRWSADGRWLFMVNNIFGEEGNRSAIIIKSLLNP